MSDQQLVLVGDSLLAQVNSDRTELVEQELGADWVVLNCATGGFVAAQCRRQALHLAATSPTAVLVSIGTNDAAPHRGVTVEAFERDLVEVLRSFDRARRLVLLPPGIDESRREPTNHRSNAVIDRYRDAAARAASTAGAACVDGRALARSVVASGGDPFVEDGVHLTDAMYEVMASELGALLR